ncbi:MAG TPA: hypothetical protein VN366_08860, partial [Feifaniaceae bacterium]|nr:hypothetical protein [Feifaniaceae bacterium]
PKTDGNVEETVTFVMQRHFDNLPVTDSVKDLLPGWLPDALRDKIFTMDASSGYWKMQNQDNPDEWIGFDLYVAINGEDWVDGMLEQEIIGLPEGYSAGSMPVGSGFLLRYESASEGSEPTEYWMLRVSEDTYVQCYGSVSREDQMKIIENLGT